MPNDGTVGVDLAIVELLLTSAALNECPPQSATARVGNVDDNRRNNRNFSAKVVEHVELERQARG